MDWKTDRIASALAGENPTVLASMRSGFVVLADLQFLPGYCILLAYPKVGSLNELNPEKRAEFLADMVTVGDAITAVCGPARVNYEILGNTDAYLHAHVIPRYTWEEEQRRKGPLFLYPEELWSREEYQFDAERHAELKGRLSDKLASLIRESYR